MIMSNKISVIVKNVDGYKLTVNKNKCVKPNDTYEIVLTQEHDGNAHSITLYMSEEELGYLARALVV